MLVDPEDDGVDFAPDDPEPESEDVDDDDSAFFSVEPEPEPASEPDSFGAVASLPADDFTGSRLSLR